MGLTTKQVRERFLNGMEKNGHAVIRSASLVPDQDATTLFVGSGMQPLVPYLLGAEHPLGKRIANAQRCLRAQDIEEVGDSRHTTFFEMLGNWSLGDYFKKEQITRLFIFLTDAETGLGLDPTHLYVTVFGGDAANGLPKDEESADIWRGLFKTRGIDAKTAVLETTVQGDKIGMRSGERIFYYNASKNWWSRAGVPEAMPLGEPGGGCSEVFYDFGEKYTDPVFRNRLPHPNSDSGRFVEIANSVFMEYVKQKEGFMPLPKKNVDFGAGLERMVAATRNDPDVFRIDVFAPLIALFGEEQYRKNPLSVRIIADHIRAASFIIADGVEPSNTDRGYVLRRLIRRAMFHNTYMLDGAVALPDLLEQAMAPYTDTLLKEKTKMVRDVVEREAEAFQKTLLRGFAMFEKKKNALTADVVFELFSTYGFPFELTREMAEKEGIKVSKEAFFKQLKTHKAVSRASSARRFKGGLSDTGAETVRYHTAVHLLYQALRDVLGAHVVSKGSNITPERMRFDFSHSEQLSEKEIAEVERLLNEKIDGDMPVTYKDVSRAEADRMGALCSSEAEYTDPVRVYSIGNYSKEFCGGPHVHSTGEIGHIRIVKQESVGRGTRRLRAAFAD